MSRRLRLAALAGMAALVCACGGGGGGGDPATPPGGNPPAPASGNTRFPMAAGDRWIYEVTDAGSAPTREQVDVGDTTVVAGQPRTELVSASMDGTVLETEVYVANAAGLTLLPRSGDTFATAVGPLLLWREPISVGDTFVQVDKTVTAGRDLDGDGVDDLVAVRSVVQLAERATRTTPAGTFPDAMRVRTSVLQTFIYSRTGQRATSDLVLEDWYADGVGLLSRETRGGSSANAPVITRSVLQAYRAGTRRGGAAPAAVGVSPDDARIHNGSVVVRADFGVAMEAASLDAGGFVVRDAQGAVVPGSVVVTADGLSATFVPLAGWQSGDYTASLTPQATDRVGNAAVARNWSFSLDTVRPTVAVAVPLDGASGVPTDTPLRFTFSEPLDPQTVLTSQGAQIGLVEVQSGAAVQALVEFDGVATVTLRPLRYLEHDRAYRVSFPACIADVNGNPLEADLTVRFRSVPGAFAPAVPLAQNPGSQPRPAFGDLDGDGLLDIVWTSFDTATFPPQLRLHVRRGTAAGEWAAPTQPLGATLGSCSLPVAAIGDSNGDGRNDVVLGGTCGIRVLLQEADGRLTVGPTYPLPGYDYAAAIRLIDLNGDGRLDMLSIGNSASIRVWMQSNAGTFVETRLIDTGLGSLTELVLADLDGDGLQDLIVASIGMQSQRLAVLKGAAGGQFGAPVQLPTGDDGWPWGLDAGDLDGDGRLDVVVAMANANAPRVLVFRQQPDGSFAAPQATALGASPTGLTLLDADADGRWDLAVTYEDALSVSPLVGPGRFGAPDYYAVPQIDITPISAFGPRDGMRRAPVQLNGQVYFPKRVQAGGLGSGRAGWGLAVPAGASAR